MTSAHTQSYPCAPALFKLPRVYTNGAMIPDSELPTRRELNDIEFRESWCRIIYAMVADALAVINDGGARRSDKLQAVYFLEQGGLETWLAALGLTVRHELVIDLVQHAADRNAHEMSEGWRLI